ncbi:MAG: helix-turn-helix domain-containing protein [Cellvibrio sp.]|uniref:MerR family transcriptional regulator n=1 Tax=Cellvibrio sp. TaxID=1965322 RepID=UPI00271DD188|nr:helix-turn-helix domain-containing protein [Cellvibrio sp.]
MALSIGDFSKATGCAIETIRYYERAGIISKPPRSSGGHRLYNQTNVQQLRFVLKARQMGFSLAEVKELLNLATDEQQPCQEVLDMADRNLEAIQRKIDQLSGFKQELQGLSRTCKTCCAGKASASECNIIEAMHTLAYSAA